MIELTPEQRDKLQELLANRTNGLPDFIIGQVVFGLEVRDPQCGEIARQLVRQGDLILDLCGANNVRFRLPEQRRRRVSV